MSTTNEAVKPKDNKKKIFPILLVLIVGAGAIFGVSKYLHGMSHEETDDAQIDANISPVIPRISGYVSEVRVKDNQSVKAGDTLIILDKREMAIKVQQAEAALASARSSLSVAQASADASGANVVTAGANISTADAQIEAAKVNVWRATQDYQRYSNLIKDHSVTQQQYEQAVAAKETAEKQLKILEEQRNAAYRQKNALASQSAASGQQIGVANGNIQQKQAELDAAKLNLSYTVIIAATDGYVSKINIQPGQLVNAGQQLFTVVMDQHLWVTANFKETQLEKMREGQKVIIHVDAFPNHEFNGKIASFSPATGARFSLLPPDNASGNFVKVVQRIPVKIVFTATGDKAMAQIKPGMNVKVDVNLD